MNDILNNDFVDLNKAWSHTLENDMDKDDYVVSIQIENEINADEEHLLKTSSLDEEEIVEIDC